MSRSRFFNLLGAAPLIAWYVWGLLREIPAFAQSYHALGGAGYGSMLFMLGAVAQVSGIAFTSLLILLLVIRDAPQEQAREWAPFSAAFIGTFASASMFFLPVATRPAPLLFVATVCIIIGLGFSLYTLLYLGRSFAMLPSARTLVVDGPYHLVRHPLYLFEEIALVGIMIQFQEPWSVLVLTVHFAAQVVRMHHEEQILAKAFPEYASYAARTARFIPGIY